MASSATLPEPRIAVFAKAPIPGAVKTRLAPLLGDAGAADLHARLVRNALAAACAAKLGPVELWCAPDSVHVFFTRCARDFPIALRQQRGPDLGARMAYAFQASLAGGVPLILIGSDCPGLDAQALRLAAAALRDRDVVFAPADDGGYVLVGMRRFVPAAFESIKWGSATVMEETRERLARSGATWSELGAYWDVDRPDDYARLQREGLLDEATP